VTFLLPVALVALIVAPLIYLVHLLRSSRRRVHVPALFLWADLPRTSSGKARRRWPPITLLLLLQLLAALLAGFALARPATSSEPPRHVALVLDASASMQATDVAPTRFDVARTRAGQRLAGLTASDQVSLVRAGSEADLLASGTPNAVRGALNAAQPGAGSAAIREALALASSQVSSTPDRRGQIVLVTDVAWPAPASVGVLAAPVEVEAIGGGSDNQAVRTLQVRLEPSGLAQSAFIEITNDADHAVRLPMRLTADGAPLDQRDVDLMARGRTRLSLPLPVDARQVGVRLLGRDALVLDDVAETIAPGGPPRNVLLVGRASASLRRALESIPFVRLEVADVWTPERPRPDLTVMNATLPTQLPPGPLLVVDPPVTSARLVGVGLGSAARVQDDHPLLQGLDLAALRAETPTVGGVPGWARVVLGTPRGPLVMEGRIEGRPTLVLTFDATTSGLDKSLAYPLLMSNATSFLLNQSQRSSTSLSEPFDTTESDIRPRAVPSFASSAMQVEAAEGWFDRWPLLVAACLLVLGLEWIVFARRG
jgi:Ca-activated chloride channel homolog